MLVVSFGKQESKNAEFGQVGRPLEAVQIPVLPSVVLDFWRWSVSLVRVLWGCNAVWTHPQALSLYAGFISQVMWLDKADFNIIFASDFGLS